jgi:hypothetical protein
MQFCVRRANQADHQKTVQRTLGLRTEKPGKVHVDPFENIGITLYLKLWNLVIFDNLFQFIIILKNVLYWNRYVVCPSVAYFLAAIRPRELKFRTMLHWYLYTNSTVRNFESVAQESRILAWTCTLS